MSQIHLPHDHGQPCEKLEQHIRQSEQFRDVAEVFKQLSDGTRLQLFWVLCHCEECVTNLSAILQMSAPALSHHLRLLKQDQLVVSRRVGKEVYYKAANTPTTKALHDAMEAVMAITCPMEP